AFGAYLNNVATGQAAATGVGFSALMGGLFAFLASGVSEAFGSVLAKTVVDRPSVFDDRVNEIYENLYEDSYSARDFWDRMSIRSKIIDSLSTETTFLENSLKNNLLLAMPGTLFSAIYAGIGALPTTPTW